MNMESYAKTEFQPFHLDLPNEPCPRNLFISLVSKKYLGALYLVEPSIFPQNWPLIVKVSPMGAWNTLNKIVINYLNSRYSPQGLQIGKSETALLTLAQKISENISNDIKDNDGNSSKILGGMKPQNDEFDLLSEKLQIVFDLVANDIVKLTGREVTIHISIDDKKFKMTKLPKLESFDELKLFNI